MTETQATFGPVLPDRACGGCRVCCEHLVVDTAEFSKPAGTLCRHACATGCGIHATRFAVCRDWHCLWRHIPDLPETARPDLCGILWGHAWSEGDHPRFRTVYVHGICIEGLAALDTAEGRAALDHFRQGDLPVWVSEPGGPMRRLYPGDREAQLPEWSTGLRDPVL